MKDPLDDALGLPPMERQQLELIPPVPVSSDEDYETARANIHRLLEKGERQLDELGDIASVSQHPKAYEIYSLLFKAVVDANKDLMGIKKTKKDIDGAPSVAQDGPKTVNNTLFCTSEEVLRMIKGNKE